MQSAPGAGDLLAGMIASAELPEADTLHARLEQFRAETEEIIPTVTQRLAAGDIPGLREPVAQSQRLAESGLRNQIPETSFLARRAAELGAAAASAFGAGFGGSVWALVRIDEMTAFMSQWRADYLARFPERRSRADFFPSSPAPAATEL
jgi:galactokinase